MEVLIKILQQKKNQDLCLLGYKVFENLSLDEGKVYKLHLGLLSTPCSFEPCESSRNTMFLNEKMMGYLMIYNNISLNIWKREDDIFIGPVVGMFVRKTYFNAIADGSPPVGAVEHIEQASPHANCLSYCFGIDNIDWKEKKIKGYTFNSSSSKWEYRWLPMPDIIYDRGSYLKPDEKIVAADMRELFSDDPNVRFINPIGSLGKWQLYKKLSKYPDIKENLPETIIYNSFQDINSMLDKYGFIFVKSSMGSRGEEVLSIEKIGKKYRIDYFQKELRETILDNAALLQNHIDKFISDKRKIGRETFIIQQGLRLIKYDGHHMDFRLHLVKNEEGKWEAINFYATHSSGDSKITNYCVGGICYLYEKIYENLKKFNDKIRIPTQHELGAFTIKMAAYIDKAFGNHGEIGIDIALDEKGKLWFLEGNAKPDKQRVTGIDDMEGISPQALAIFKYSLYLAKTRK